MSIRRNVSPISCDSISPLFKTKIPLLPKLLKYFCKCYPIYNIYENIKITCNILSSIHISYSQYSLLLITRGACGPTSLKMGSFRRPVAILQTITRFCNHPDRLCETCSNSCALVAILSLAYLVLVRVLTCLLSTKKIRNVAGKCLYIN